MNPVKRLFRSDAVQAILSRLVARYLRVIGRTTRWTVICPAETERLLAQGRPFIACFWHGRMAMMPAATARQDRIHVMISEHRDGLLVSRAIARLGVRTIAASRKRGGAAALRAAQRLLATGGSVAITPDGPRGPRMRAKPGAIKAAQLSGAPILCVSGSVRRRRILNSWDRFCLALPFSRGVILWDTPFAVPREAGEADLERLRRRLEERLNHLTAEADRHFGQPVVEPAAAVAAEDSTGHARA